MMRPSLLLAPVLALTCLVPTARAGCTHLIIDPKGDVSQAPDGSGFPAPVDAESEIDLLSADLVTTSRTITATLRMVDLNPEAQTVLDHAYELSFAARGERYTLFAAFDKTHQWGEVWHDLASTNGSAEDPDNSGATAGEGIGEATVTLDPHKDTVTITAQRRDFDATGGLGGTLKAIRSYTWSGAGDPVGGAFSSADWGTTTRSYQVGSRSC